MLRIRGSESIFGTHFTAMFTVELHKGIPIPSGCLSCVFLPFCSRNSRGSGAILAAPLPQAHLTAHSSPWGSWAGHGVCPCAPGRVPSPGGQQEHTSSVQAGCAGGWRNPALRQAALQVPRLLQQPSTRLAGTTLPPPITHLFHYQASHTPAIHLLGGAISGSCLLSVMLILAGSSRAPC